MPFSFPFHQSIKCSSCMQLLYIFIVYIYSMVTVYTCKYCWQQVRRCDYEEHIGRSCQWSVFQCGEHIARKMIKQHCQQQCNNAKRITSQQQDVITCIAVQETDEQ